ncbi:regenerating islet-derived protein 3-gamma-like isoform X2 [Elephas maximus indicus]|uniref:regenerating islet-derived protein 3-gamma-like isoform X2 n=1 Tax=Elephas maximus indicus TaxID=99487 RepID=UPI002116FACB|nr:regenerating islet-derived protein 3-gamma-like isoform X2 [Elephas maximus indicus]
MLPPMALFCMSGMLLSCLMLLSQVQGEEDSPKEHSSARIKCPGGSNAYGSYCYALFLTPKTWVDAEGLEPNAGGWEWSSWDVLNYFAWERDPSTVLNSGHCGSLSRNTGFLKWKDYNCDQRLPYVCQFKN